MPVAPSIFQVIRRIGDFRFDHDVDVSLVGEARALEPAAPPPSGFPGLNANDLAPPAACRAPAAAGTCKGAFEAYWFDANAGACRSFLWGGCGDPPPFETLEACRRACLPD